MKSDARAIRLGDLSLRITKGTTPTTLGHSFAERGINFVKSEAITNDGSIDASTFAFIDPSTHAALSRSQLQQGDVLFSMAGVYLGKTAVVPAAILPANTNQAVGIIRLDPVKADSRFIHYVLSSPECRSWVGRSVAQSAQPNFNLQDIGNLPIPMRSLDEQRRIAYILGTLDDKIELNRRMNETLEAMARALFKSWFVDFDPVRAKMAGRDPGLPKDITDLFPDRLVESELGEIPEGWVFRPVSDLAEVVGGSTPRTNEAAYWEGGTHFWATPKDLSGLSSPVLLSTERSITDAGLAQIGSGLLPVGTVLMSSRAPIGYLAIAEVAVAINQGFIAMKPKVGISNLFLLYWAEHAQEEILSRANGSTFLEISKVAFRPINVSTATLAVMDVFHRTARSLLEKIVSNLRESYTLSRLRDSLLPKLISGEVRPQSEY